MARLMGVPVSIQLWQQIMTTGYKEQIECIEGLPEGAELVTSYYDGVRSTVVLVFHHESFKEVGEAGHIPMMMPIFRRYYEGLGK